MGVDGGLPARQLSRGADRRIGVDLIRRLQSPGAPWRSWDYDPAVLRSANRNWGAAGLPVRQRRFPPGQNLGSLIFTVFFDELRNLGTRLVCGRLGNFEAVGCERTVGVALGFVLLDVSRLAPRPRRRMQGDMGRTHAQGCRAACA
jgi:hypothetical protein